MIPEVGEHIDQLRQMTTAQLRLKYHELFGCASHSNHKGYLVRRLAWRLQSLAGGGLSERARQYAREISDDAALRLCAPKQFGGAPPTMPVATTSRRVDPRVPAPGTQPVKCYKNETITVTVLEDGFQLGERVYKSLSAIARQVTGTRWNGYSSFALNSRKGVRRASE